jgi:CBS domain containing-hemolysin-like protein
MSEPLGVFPRLLAVLLLVGLNGFFVAAEYALVSVRRTRMAELAAQGSPGALLVMGNWAGDPVEAFRCAA